MDLQEPRVCIDALQAAPKTKAAEAAFVFAWTANRISY
jgi:hypothetical protein